MSATTTAKFTHKSNLMHIRTNSHTEKSNFKTHKQSYSASALINRAYVMSVATYLAKVCLLGRKNKVLPYWWPKEKEGLPIHTNKHTHDYRFGCNDFPIVT